MGKKIMPLAEEVITNKIHLIRGKSVMLDSDLAVLYEVETKRINEQVKRNAERFPEDFMFQLTNEEWRNLKSQFATSNWGGRRSLPFAFTEHGVLMLSSVLKSERAIAVNINIMRVYNKLKEMLLNHHELLIRMEKLEKQVGEQGTRIAEVFNYLNKFVQQETDRKQVGYKK